MSADAVSPRRDNGTSTPCRSGASASPAVNGDTADGQDSRSSGGLEESGGGGCGTARVRRKRRHTCPDYRRSPPPLENGWHGVGERLSPPPRLGAVDGSAVRSAGSRRSSEGDGWGRAGRCHERPAKLARLEACVKKEPAEPVAATVTPEKSQLNNGDGADEPPSVDGEGEPKEEPPDRADSPPPPPTPTADTRKRNLTETEKLYLNSECHKTEILSSKLRHTACRMSGAAAAASATSTTPAQPPVLMPNGGDSKGPKAKRRRRAPVPRRRRLPSVESPATDSESDGPPHLEPEAPLTAAPRGAAGRGKAQAGRRGTPAPQLREAESEADAVSFSFQAAPDSEEWFRTFSRQEAGRRAVEDFSWAAAGGGQLLPYQMSVDELFPPDLVPGGGRPRPLRPPTLPDRWLPPLPAAAEERVAADKAPPADWLCLEEMCRVLHRAADSPPAEVEPPGTEVAAALTAWPAHTSLHELAEAVNSEELGSADWSGADSASEPSRPPTPDASADDASSVSTDTSAGTGGRRRPVKRRKNRTGWPRARVRKSNLLRTAVSRAAAEAEAGRDTPGPS
ncbi:hypothetical protein FJT64_009765 [Amphibalanus amphitrite]|uniref:Uncharacterized protein n=1 Tax=Amphibalanus amphitrite TaxID=1232801 RepID=A0A6A4VKZ8_AMPAM|nr:hypothetical protein FJT64_009765 [Amphibalanus amphitrite]